MYSTVMGMPNKSDLLNECLCALRINRNIMDEAEAPFVLNKC